MCRALAMLCLSHAPCTALLRAQAAALSDFKGGMLMAEQAILFSLNFNLVVPASLNVLRDVTQELALQPPVDPANVPDGMGVEEAQGRLKLYKYTLQILQDRCFAPAGRGCGGHRPSLASRPTIQSCTRTHSRLGEAHQDVGMWAEKTVSGRPLQRVMGKGRQRKRHLS